MAYDGWKFLPYNFAAAEFFFKGAFPGAFRQE
jgi:hypothetical protein